MSLPKSQLGETDWQIRIVTPYPGGGYRVSWMAFDKITGVRRGSTGEWRIETLAEDRFYRFQDFDTLKVRSLRRESGEK